MQNTHSLWTRQLFFPHGDGMLHTPHLTLFLFLTFACSILIGGCFPTQTGVITPGLTFSQDRPESANAPHYSPFQAVAITQDGIWVADLFGLYSLTNDGGSWVTGDRVAIEGEPDRLIPHGHLLYVSNKRGRLFIFDTSGGSLNLIQTLRMSNFSGWINDRYLLQSPYLSSQGYPYYATDYSLVLYEWQEGVLTYDGVIIMPAYSHLWGLSGDDYIYMTFDNVEVYGGIFTENLSECDLLNPSYHKGGRSEAPNGSSASSDNPMRGVYFIPLPGLQGIATWCQVQGGILYVKSFDAETSSCLLSLYDLTQDPLAPPLLGMISFGTFNMTGFSLAQDGRTALITGYTNSSFTDPAIAFLDLTDPADIRMGTLMPVEVNFNPTAGSAFTGSELVSVDQDAVVTVQSWDGNIEDPLDEGQTIDLTRFPLPDFADRSGNVLVELFWDARTLYTYTVDPDAGDTDQTLRWNGSLPLPDGVQDRIPELGYADPEVFAFRITPHGYLLWVGSHIFTFNANGTWGELDLAMEEGERINDWELKDDHLFILIQNRGVVILDLSDPASPSTLRQFATVDPAYEVWPVDTTYLVLRTLGYAYGSRNHYEIWNWSVQEPFMTDTLVREEVHYSTLYEGKDGWFYLLFRAVPVPGFGSPRADASRSFPSNSNRIFPYHVTASGTWEGLGDVPLDYPIARSYLSGVAFDTSFLFSTDPYFYNLILLDTRDAGRPRYADTTYYANSILSILPGQTVSIFLTPQGYALFETCGRSLPEESPFGWLDTPVEGASVSTDTLTVSGWVLDPNGYAINSLIVFVDGESMTILRVGGEREDIAALFPDDPLASTCGFGGSIDLTETAPGGHRLVVAAQSAGATWSVIGIVDFTKE